MHDLNGKTLEAIYITDDKLHMRFVTTDGEEIIYHAAFSGYHGGAYFYQIEGANDLFCEPIIDVVESRHEDQWLSDDDCEGTAVWRFVTQKHGDTMTLEFRAEHNGYYSGWPTNDPDDGDAAHLEEDAKWLQLMPTPKTPTTTVV